jgi:hypothetical protein
MPLMNLIWTLIIFGLPVIETIVYEPYTVEWCHEVF